MSQTTNPLSNVVLKQLAEMKTQREAIENSDANPSPISTLQALQSAALTRFKFHSIASGWFDGERHWSDDARSLYGFFADAEDHEFEPVLYFGGWLQGWVDTSDELRKRVSDLRDKKRKGIDITDEDLTHLLAVLDDGET